MEIYFYSLGSGVRIIAFMMIFCFQKGLTLWAVKNQVMVYLLVEDPYQFLVLIPRISHMISIHAPKFWIFCNFQMASDLMNPAQCNICEATVAKFNCNTCGDALCATCKGYHLKSKGSRNHKIVPYAEKLNPKYLAALLCPKHRTHGPKFWCNTCGIPICDSCIISPEHEGHKFSYITTTLSERRDAMLSEMKTLRDHIVVEWEAVLKEAKTMNAEYQSDVDKIGKELVARAKEVHKQVDDILSTSQKTLQRMKVSGLAKLQQQEKYLEDKLSQMKEDVERYESQLRDADPNAVLQFQQGQGQSKDKTKPPALEMQSPPVFTKGPIEAEAVENMFGELSTQVISQMCVELPMKHISSHSNPQPAISSDFGETTATSSGDTSAGICTRSLPLYVILNPSVQHQFDVDYDTPLIACVEQGQAWLKTRYTMLELVDRDRSVRDTINTDFAIYGIAVTPDGDLLISDYDNNCIKWASRRKTISILFSTSGMPFDLCCLRNGDILVTFPDDSEVVIYNMTGKILQTLDHIKFRVPISASVNKVNNHIYICDKENSRYFSTGKVMAVGAHYKLRYEYTGHGDSKFTPFRVCTDQMGHVLITDHINHRVHMLDQAGRFIQYILTSQQGLHKPRTIDVDREGYVWVGEEVGYKGRVKVARYLE